MRKFQFLQRWPFVIAIWAITGLCLFPVILSSATASQNIYLPLMIKAWPPVNTRPPTPVVERVLLTEIMINPVGEEPAPEWFELYNDGGADISLAGYKIGDEETPGGNEGLLQFPDEAILSSGRIIVIARQAALFEATYGLKAQYEIDETDPLVPNLFKCASGCRTSIELTNGGDELIIYDPAGDVVDALAWGNSAWQDFQPPIKPPSEGSTLVRYPAYADTDAAFDWREQSIPDPGQVNLQPPTPTPGPTSKPDPTITPLPFKGNLLISEVLANPIGSEPGSEWYELYNPDDITHSLAGVKLGDEETYGGSEGMKLFPEEASIAAKEVIIIANQAAAFETLYHFSPDYEIKDSDPAVPDLLSYDNWGSGSINLSNSGDEILLIDAADQLIDLLVYGDSAYPGFQPPVLAASDGASLERYPLIPGTNTANNWHSQTTPAPGQVDLSPTPTPTLVPPLVFNEIHADPHASNGDANGDGRVNSSDDEFIEIVNTTTTNIDIGGWMLYDEVSWRHTFPFSTILPAKCSLVIFGGGTPSGTFGDSLVYTSTTKSLGLNNNGDTLTLYNAEATAVISTTYGSEASNDQAITRNPDIFGHFAQHMLIEAAAKQRFSPGTQLDGESFEGCRTSIVSRSAKPISSAGRFLFGCGVSLFVMIFVKKRSIFNAGSISSEYHSE